jgi:hypothetical protein
LPDRTLEAAAPITPAPISECPILEFLALAERAMPTIDLIYDV